MSNQQLITDFTKANRLNDIDTVRILIENGADINLAIDDKSILCHIIRFNAKECLKLLLECGTDVSFQNYQPFVYAIEHNHEEFIKEMLQYTPTSIPECVLSELLTTSIFHGNKNIVSLFLQLGATKVNKSIYTRKVIYKCPTDDIILLLSSYSIDLTDVMPLFLKEVILYNRLSTLQLLFELGATMEMIEKFTLQICDRFSDDNATDVIYYLIESGININTDFGQCIMDNYIRAGSNTMVSMLLNLNYDIFRDDYSSLDAASFYRNLEVLDILTNSSRLELSEDKLNELLSYTITSHGHIDITKFWLDYGATGLLYPEDDMCSPYIDSSILKLLQCYNINVEQHISILIESAVRYNDVPKLKMLLEMNPDIKMFTQPTLQLATYHVKCMKSLLKFGCHPDSLRMHTNNIAILELLDKYGIVVEKIEK